MSVGQTLYVLACVALFGVVADVAAGEPPKDLWDMTEYRKVPLNLQKISSRKAPLQAPQAQDWPRAGDSWVKGETKTQTNAPAATASASAGGNLVAEQYTFDCGTSPDGSNRIFFGLARPENAQGKLPVVVIFHGGGGHGNDTLAIAAARNYPGFAAIAMDYNGQFAPGAKQATVWRSVTKQMRERTLNVIPDLRNVPLYHYVMAARRLLDTLNEFPALDSSRLACAGVSYGGMVAFNLAGVDERVKCVVAAVSAGGFEGTASRQSQVLRWGPPDHAARWLATYDPIAHAPQTRAAVLFNLSADDTHFWLSGAMRHYRALAGEKRLLIRPNSDHGAGGPELPDRETSAAWVRHALLNEETLPEVDERSLRADGSVYSWRVNSPQPITHAVLYWSPGNVVSSARYWVGFPAAKDGELWKAQIPDHYAALAAELYVTVWDAKGRAVSSPTIAREGLDPQREAGQKLWADDSLWDIERGADAWRLLTATGGAKTLIEEPASPRGVKLAPAGDGKKFKAITNSIVLASGHASKHKGLRLSLNGNGTAGRLTVGLVRDCNSLDEVRLTASADYDAGASQIVIPWSAFKPAPGVARGAPPAPPGDKSLWPFNGLVIEGERADNQPVTIGTIAWAD